jgi:hypothetical protein
MDNSPENKLHMLHKYYNQYKKRSELTEQLCPFSGGKYDHASCSILCYTFEEISADQHGFGCPCHIWGPHKAIQKLKQLLINYDMLKED